MTGVLRFKMTEDNFNSTQGEFGLRVRGQKKTIRRTINTDEIQLNSLLATVPCKTDRRLLFAFRADS